MSKDDDAFLWEAAAAKYLALEKLLRKIAGEGVEVHSRRVYFPEDHVVTLSPSEVELYRKITAPPTNDED